MKLTHGGDWAGYIEEYGKEPLDYSSNVSPLGIPEGVKRAAAEAMERADRYPDPLCRQLKAALSRTWGVPADRILCGNGASDLILRVARGLAPKRALVTAPTFSEYEEALAKAGCACDHFPLKEEDDFRVTEEILGWIGPGLDLLILCEPNNPTGRTTDPALLRRILARCGETGVRLMVDECFMEFLTDRERHTLVGELAAHPELLILRAFTKSFAMAGLRLGYLLCGSAETAAAIEAAGQPWAVSVPAQEAGIAALKEAGFLEEMRALTARERTRMMARMEALGLRVIPGEADYLLFDSGDPELGDALREKGILIRDCSNYIGLRAGWYRAAVKREEQNDAFLQALTEVINNG